MIDYIYSMQIRYVQYLDSSLLYMHVTTFPSGVISEQSFCCKNISLQKKMQRPHTVIVSTHGLESAYMYINTFVATSYTLAV